MNHEDLNYLAATLVGEARGESIESIIGVANVIRNRCLASGKSYKEVVLSPNQFSCWNESKNNIKNDKENHSFTRDFLNKLENGDEISDPYLIQCIAVAKDIIDNNFVDNTQGSKNYVTTSIYQLAKTRGDKEDKWINSMKATVVLGNHIFLIEKKDKDVASTGSV